LSDYLAELYTPGSPNYHHYLDPGQLAARYGAAPATISSALAYFEAAGVVASVSPDGLLLDLTGTPAQLGTAFHTPFDRYRTGPTTWVVSHPTPAELPASIPWSGALGLGNASPVHPAVSSPLASTAVAGPDASCPTGAPYVPCQVWGAYDLADLISNGTDGAGLTIGVVDTYDGQEPESQLATDLASFDESNALPAPLLDFLYPVPTTTDLNATSNGWAYEEALDLQWAHATAPGAAIDMTFSPNSGAGLYEAIDFLVAHDLVNVISLSWGEPDVGIYNAFQGPCSAGCNASTDGSYDILSPVLEFAAAEGISVFAATGDCGAADGTSGVATNYPASDPYVTAVGGTDLSVSETGEWADETGWSGNATGATGPGCYNQGGSGGGYSPLPRPSWQSGPGLSAGSFRATPDVSAISAPGVIVFENSQSYVLEGTSVATPIWAGIAAIADQVARTPLGFLDPSLYALFRGGGYTTDFHDIRVGNNGYAAGVGWDAVTGIGSPVVGPLVAALAKSPAPTSTLSVDLNASVTSGPSPLEVTFFENASGGSGLYPVEGVYFGDGTAAATGTGEIAHVYSSPGVYSAQAYTWDSAGNISDSLPLAMVVGGGASLSVGLNVSTSTPASGQSVTFDANATGGVGPYVYDYWFGDGTFLNGSSSPVVSHTYAERGGYCAVAIAADSASPPNGGESIPLAVTVGGAPAPSCTVDRGARTLTPTPGL
ncbi:MAG TPA: protease pro-enzyme activation domain-containing protein, partial [Thermoplasmata archaeon]|nr:protease pro-enzyme activation domain-containing protein [Thermoplasmata archaeon]